MFKYIFDEKKIKLNECRYLKRSYCMLVRCRICLNSIHYTVVNSIIIYVHYLVILILPDVKNNLSNISFLFYFS